ncbi:hypothetical protein [Rhizobium sp. 9140]|uniref:hypothetical protein n=1 Tax=Rhizobium sp. 9140 TaxID=1761900 RepID=UPI000798410C|nr:hypothetical protein [Rhizobium sp. 9140]CZT36334.1 hypothetical protein GA0004734_00033330 [Rhizobium sp. 9140]
MQETMEGHAMPMQRLRPAPGQKSRTVKPTLRILAIAGALALSAGLWIGAYALVRLVW